MNFKQHKKRHIKLHAHLEELVEDYLNEANGSLNKDNILALLEWSYLQTKNPSDNQKLCDENKITDEIQGVFPYLKLP